MPQKVNVCSVEGCTKRYFGAGYCGMHYQRVRKYGHLEETRPTSWGKRKTHPRYQQWANMLRRPGGCSEHWDTFDRFLEDTGEKPSENHGLYPIRPDEPIGPSNFRWVLVGNGMERPRRKGDSCKIEGCNKKVHALDLCTMHHARWLRSGTTDDPEPRKVDIVKKIKKANWERTWKYGITPDEYKQMYETQKGECKICNKWHELLAIDHEHLENETSRRRCQKQHIRGLICIPCNTGLGMLKDSISNLQSAIIYLEDYELRKKKSLL